MVQVHVTPQTLSYQQQHLAAWSSGWCGAWLGLPGGFAKLPYTRGRRNLDQSARIDVIVEGSSL